MQLYLHYKSFWDMLQDLIWCLFHLIHMASKRRSNEQWDMLRLR